jgi:hypothetical protein
LVSRATATHCHIAESDCKITAFSRNSNHNSRNKVINNPYPTIATTLAPSHRGGTNVTKGAPKVVGRGKITNKIGVIS